MKKDNFISKVKCCMQIVHVRFSFILKGLFLLFLLFTLPEFQANAGDNIIDENGDLPLVYDDLSVNVIVAGYGNFYVNAVYTEKGVLYINIEELFIKLKIPCVVRQNGTLLEGTFGTQIRPYVVDYSKVQIKIGSKIIKAKNGMVKETGALYVQSSLFAEAFGIVLTFDFRSLRMILKSDFELPIIKEMRIEKMRTGISKLRGEVKADTIIKRNYHLLKLGTLDWTIASTQAGASSQAGKGINSNNIGLGIGTEFLCGEANVSGNYSSQYNFDVRQLQYLWRWVDNDKKFIKQAQIGRISSQTISTIYSPIIGGVIRNTPTTVRKATGSYSICDFTEPNWNVELYINNMLVDFTTADASGLYGFTVPIIYGYTSLKLKFYGPRGEVQTVERTMNIPYTVMAAKEFEYGLTGGMVQDSISSRFGKVEFNYGVNSVFTIGGGVEYLSSIPGYPFIPFAKFTIQPFNEMIINYEYAHGVKDVAMLNYYLTKDILLEINYTKYWAGQRVANFKADIERKVKLSIPFSFKKISGFVKLDYLQSVYSALINNQSTVTFSTYYKKISANTATQINWIEQRTPKLIADTVTNPTVLHVLSNLSLSYRIGKGFNLKSSAQYSVNEKKLVTGKVTLDKSFQKGNFSVSYEKNILNSGTMISLSFGYNLSFATTNISASQDNGILHTSESVQGSMAFGGGKNYIHKTNNSSVGKGGILIYPFLDLNNNGIFDKGEHLVKLKAVRVSGGEAVYRKKDSIVRIPDLIPFTYYRIEFTDNDLENIAWRFKKKVYQVLVDPNQFKRIYVPVKSLGEVSGTTFMKSDNLLNGIGRILVKIYNKKTTKQVTELITESDGYFYYLGLEPGEYFARVDSVQLRNLDYKAAPLQRDFTIKPTDQGDIVAGIDFVLTGKKIEEKTIEKKIDLLEKKLIPIDKTLSSSDKINVPNENIFIPNQKTFIPIKTSIDLNQKGMIYTIQLASLNYYTDPAAYKKKLNLTEDVWYFQRDGVYNYVTGKYINEEEAMSDMVQLGITGFVTVVDPSKTVMTPNQKGIDSNEKLNDTKEKEVIQVEETIVPNKNEIASKEQPIASGEKGMIFTIQLAASKTYIEPEVYKKEFNLTEDVWFFEKDGFFKYATGKYGTKAQATAAMVQRGIKGIITSVDQSKIETTPTQKGIDSNNKSNDTKEKQVIPVQEIIVPNKNETNSSEKTIVPAEKVDIPVKNEIVPKEQPIVSGEKGVIFTIQLAASKTYIEPDVYKKQFNLTEDVWFFEKDGYFKYATGKYGTKAQATAAMVQRGIKGYVSSVDLSIVKENPIVK